ncbi:MAG: hypothetical protein HGA14_01810, partial [Chlorobaculum sp.]|nr:hypothetical protein [Chlorobaculum sp.]
YKQLNTLDDDTLKELATEALTIALKFGVESAVMQTLLSVLYEACDEDEDKLKALLDSLGFDA